MKRYAIFAAVSCVMLLLLLGATITNRFPLIRAYLQGPLDGNGYSLTNVSSITLSNGSSFVTNGYAAGTGFNVLHGISNSGALLILNALTNADSSIGITSNANTLKLAATNITEAKLLLADNTTADVGTAAHGLIPKMSSTSNTIPMNWGGTASWRAISNLLAGGTNVTLTVANGIVTINASGGSGSGTVALTNTVWVAKNGSNSTGARGDASKAYLTLGAANTNASSGDTILVMPGTYDEAGIALKNGVNWNFTIGAEVVNTLAGSPIFTAAANVRSRITGSGVFTNAGAGGYEVLYQYGTNTDIYFECLRASGGHATDFAYTISVTDGALRVKGGTIVGWHNPAVLVNGTASLYCDAVTLDATLNDQSSLGSALVTAATNTVTLRNCTALGSDDGSWGATTIYSVHATTAKTVYLEGTLNANLPANPNITYANVSYDGNGVENLAGKLVLAGTTNQVVFGATNDPPADTNAIVQWISVQVSGLTNQFRLPLYE